MLDKQRVWSGGKSEMHEGRDLMTTIVCLNLEVQYYSNQGRPVELDKIGITGNMCSLC